MCENTDQEDCSPHSRYIGLLSIFQTPSSFTLQSFTYITLTFPFSWNGLQIVSWLAFCYSALSSNLTFSGNAIWLLSLIAREHVMWVCIFTENLEVPLPLFSMYAWEYMCSKSSCLNIFRGTWDLCIIAQPCLIIQWNYRRFPY